MRFTSTPFSKVLFSLFVLLVLCFNLLAQSGNTVEIFDDGNRIDPSPGTALQFLISSASPQRHSYSANIATGGVREKNKVNVGDNSSACPPVGETWTPHTAASSQWESVTYGNGLFVAVAQSGTNRVMTSTDGETWTPRTAAEENQWQSVTYGNGLFVAVASDGTNRVMTSTDGETWTPRTAAASEW